MVEKSLFLQNIIAIIWDFDKTLTPRYMQEPLFKHYGIDGDVFWDEVHALPAYYARAGINVPEDTCYLGHLLAYVRSGQCADLTNAKLRELGAGIEFFPGGARMRAGERTRVAKHARKAPETPQQPSRTAAPSSRRRGG